MLSTFLKRMTLNDIERHVIYTCQSPSRQPSASFQPADWDTVTLVVVVKEGNSSKTQPRHQVNTWSYSQRRALHPHGYPAAPRRDTKTR